MTSATEEQTVVDVDVVWDVQYLMEKYHVDLKQMKISRGSP